MQFKLQMPIIAEAVQLRFNPIIQTIANIFPLVSQLQPSSSVAMARNVAELNKLNRLHCKKKKKKKRKSLRFYGNAE